MSGATGMAGSAGTPGGPGTPPPRLADRARGALVGLALGDAMGMPAAMLSPERIHDLWDDLDTFHPAPSPRPAVLGPLPDMGAGWVTGATEQAVLYGRLLARGGQQVRAGAPDLLDALETWVAALDERRAGGIVDPDTRHALARRNGANGAGPGTGSGSGIGAGATAACRAVPLGIAQGCDPLEALLGPLIDGAGVTHPTRLGLGAAAAVAASISATLAGSGGSEALSLALAAADAAGARGEYGAGPDLAARISWAVGLVSASTDRAGILALLVGTSGAASETVPVAFALASAYESDPWRGVCTAASLGGNAPEIAGLTGALLGARVGIGEFPRAAVDLILGVNPDLGLLELADALALARDVGAR